MMDQLVKACIVAPDGPVLSREEKELYTACRPFGFILFARNIETHAQTFELCKSLRDSVQNQQAPIFIDQEGGNVQRLTPPLWKRYEPASYFNELYQKDKPAAKTALVEQTSAIARDLLELGINGNCSPVCDMLHAQTHEVIIDRAYGDSVLQIVELAGLVAQTFLKHGVLPVIKHIPGHGLANVDSHQELPIVINDVRFLQENDFMIFKKLNALPFAMTAHIIYQMLDPNMPATCSKDVVSSIRDHIGFKGLLMSDDLSMGALKQILTKSQHNDDECLFLQEAMHASINAGCDLVLYCKGNITEASALLHEAPMMMQSAYDRWLHIARIYL